jgi:1-acyl-sn-glycerol-3-phosphate acyltransferase
VRRTPLWWFAVNWFRLVIWGSRVILGIQVRVTGLEHLPQGATSPAILLSKHQSTLETLLIPTLMPRPLAFVFKRELLRIPFFGWSMARLDMIHIDRESRARHLGHLPKARAHAKPHQRRATAAVENRRAVGCHRRQMLAALHQCGCLISQPLLLGVSPKRFCAVQA